MPLVRILLVVLTVFLQTMPLAAELLEPKVTYPVAQLRVLDRVTAIVEVVSVRAGESITYGPLTIMVRKCRTGDDPLAPDSIVFLEIEDTDARGTVSRVFSGWMFAQSPSLSAMEHPVYDVWVESCATS